MANVEPDIHRSKPGYDASRLIGIQYLRAAAALQVLFYHASLSARLPAVGFGFGVPLFFVISGFIMVLVTRQPVGPAQFMRRRFWRVVPLYWIVTTVAALPPAVGGSLSFRHLAASYSFLPFGKPGADAHYFPVLNVGWTLNYEMFFYALFGGSLCLPRRARPIALATVFITLVLVGLVARPEVAWAAFYTNPLILQFLVGTWLGWWWTANRSILWPVAGCACGIAFLKVSHADNLEPGLGGAIFAATLILPVLLLERSKLSIRKVGPLQFMGDASYSLYLWHPLVLAAIRHMTPITGVPFLLIGIVCSVVVGFASYLLVERPLFRHFGEDRRALTDPLTAGP